MAKKTTEQFIESAILVHGNRYDYSETHYKKALEKVVVICKKHGRFHQEASSHLKGKGCLKCKNEKLSKDRRMTSCEFVERARSVHGEEYDYKGVKYTNNRTSVEIGCRDHGAFMQVPNTHLSGSGCPCCNSAGFRLDKSGCLYVLFSADKAWMKIGISNVVKSRLKRLRWATPFRFDVELIINGAGKVMSDLEKDLHSRCESANLKGFDGSTEWFIRDDMIIKNINQRVGSR